MMKNSGQNSVRQGPVRDAKGRLTGGNPGNSGGKKGRSGRPTEDFYEWATVVRDTLGRQAIVEILKDPTNIQRLRAVEFLTRFAVAVELRIPASVITTLVERLREMTLRHIDEPGRKAAFLSDVESLKREIEREAEQDRRGLLDSLK